MNMNNSCFSDSLSDLCGDNELNRRPLRSKIASRKYSKLEIVYSDVRGSMETNSLRGHRYVVSFIDSYGRFARAYFMTNKSEVWKNLASSVLMKVYVRQSYL